MLGHCLHLFYILLYNLGYILDYTFEEDFLLFELELYKKM